MSCFGCIRRSRRIEVGEVTEEDTQHRVEVMEAWTEGRTSAQTTVRVSGSSADSETDRITRASRAVFIEYRREEDGSWRRKSPSSPSGWEVSHDNMQTWEPWIQPERSFEVFEGRLFR